MPRCATGDSVRRFGSWGWPLMGVAASVVRRCFCAGAWPVFRTFFFPTVSQIVFLKSSQMNEFKQQTR